MTKHMNISQELASLAWSGAVNLAPGTYTVDNATSMADLSPDAQMLLDRFTDAACGTTYEPRLGLAAALHAAADQVGQWDSAEELRAIAAELEGTRHD